MTDKSDRTINFIISSSGKYAAYTMRLKRVVVDNFFGLNKADLEISDCTILVVRRVKGLMNPKKMPGESTSSFHLTSGGNVYADRFQGPNGGGKSSVLKSIKWFAENHPVFWNWVNNKVVSNKQDKKNSEKKETEEVKQRRKTYGTTSLNWRDHKCWNKNATSNMALVFELDASEQEFFISWRRLGTPSYTVAAQGWT